MRYKLDNYVETVVEPITRRQNFSIVQIQSISRRQFHCGSNGAISHSKGSNIVGKGENVTCIFFLLFAHRFYKPFTKALFLREKLKCIQRDR